MASSKEGKEGKTTDDLNESLESIDDMDLNEYSDDETTMPTFAGLSISTSSSSPQSNQHTSSLSPQSGSTSPLAINLVGMSKTQDMEVSPFPTLAAREEEDAMGGDVHVIFSMANGKTIEHNFGIGQTVQMLKGWLEKEHEIKYQDQTLINASNGTVMIDPLSLNDFPDVTVGGKSFRILKKKRFEAKLKKALFVVVLKHSNKQRSCF